MHSVKCGWVGQTFALAKSNESGGKKLRIRRSKEERKEMVESFIKKHQSLNNGDFPSLNLTHKEVGGSFYTVREIVREIIQENRVLGPAKFSPEEENSGLILKQHPIGTISTEPQTSLSTSPNGSSFLPNAYKSATREPLAVSDVACTEAESVVFGDAPASNGSHVVINEPSDEPKVPEVEVIIMQETKGIIEELVSLRTNVTESDVVVQNEESDISKNEKSNKPKVPEIEGSLILETKEAVEEPLRVNRTEFDVAVPNEESYKGKVAEFISEVEKSEPPEIRKSMEERVAGFISELEKTEPLEKRKGIEEEVSFGSEVTQLENKVLLRNYEFDSPKDAEGEERGLPETEKSMEKVATSTIKVTQMAEVAVEVFPLRPVSNAIEYLDGHSSEPQISLGTLEERDVKIMPNRSSSQSFFRADDSKEVEKFPYLESGDSMSATQLEGILSGSQDKIGVDEYLSCNNPPVAKNKVFNTRNGVKTQILTNQELVVNNKPDIQHSSSLREGSNPKLDRVNIDSWQGGSRNPPGMQSNPVWVFVKSFIDAFVKFWSE